MSESFYVTGGTLRHDARCYVERRADRELLEALLRGEFCYVLTSRQMGKSSLMVRAASRLREHGLRVAVLDLTAVGQNLSPEQWYEGLLTVLGQQLREEDALEEYWLASERLGPLQRFMGAVREVLLAGADRPACVVFVDEIDAVRSLPFSTDEFFAAIRECYNRRTEDAAWNGITFCLLGVATPAELIQDSRTTPFNIGRRIELTDFTGPEAVPLAGGLGCAPQVGLHFLQRILHWTGGHPYLTQRLCEAAAAALPRAPGQEHTRSPVQLVDALCDELFLNGRAREKDDNLLFVRDRLLRTQHDLADLLDLYGRVYRQETVPDDDADPLCAVLRLSGIVRGYQGRLWVRNRVYHRVFDLEWSAAHRPAKKRVQPVNLLWQRRWRGVLPLGTAALAEDGELLVLHPDETEGRVVHALAVGSDGEPRTLLSITAERVRQFAAAPGGALLLGMAHDELFLYREGRRTRLFPGRRMAFRTLALDRATSVFLFAAADLSGQAGFLGFSDTTGRLLWERAIESPADCVALSPDGRELLAGCGDGTLLALDRARQLRWEQTLDGPVTALAAAAGCCAAGTAAGSLYWLDAAGEVTWQAPLGAPVTTLALDPAGEWLAVSAGDRARHLLACYRSDGALLWDTPLEGTPTSAAISPGGRFLALSFADGRVELHETGFSAGADASAREGWLAEVAQQVEEGDLAGAGHRLQRLLEREPDWCEAGRRLDEVETLLVAERVRQARELAETDPEAALALLAEAQRGLPYDAGLFAARTALLGELGEGVLSEAEKLAAGGETDRAQARLRFLLRLNPRHHAARAHLAALRAPEAGG